MFCVCVCVCVCSAVARYTCRERERERNDCTYYTRVQLEHTTLRLQREIVRAEYTRALARCTHSLPLVIQREWPRHQTRDDTAAGRPGQTEVGQRSLETTGCFVTGDRRGPLRTLATALRLVRRLLGIATPRAREGGGIDFLTREESRIRLRWLFGLRNFGSKLNVFPHQVVFQTYTFDFNSKLYILYATL